MAAGPGGPSPSGSHSGISDLLEARSGGGDVAMAEASAGQRSEQTQVSGPCGAGLDAAALRACVGRLNVYDAAVMDERGKLWVRSRLPAHPGPSRRPSDALSAQPLDQLRSAEAPPLYLSGRCDALASGQLQMVRRRRRFRLSHAQP